MFRNNLWYITYTTDGVILWLTSWELNANGVCQYPRSQPMCPHCFQKPRAKVYGLAYLIISNRTCRVVQENQRWWLLTHLCVRAWRRSTIQVRMEGRALPSPSVGPVSQSLVQGLRTWSPPPWCQSLQPSSRDPNAASWTYKEPFLLDCCHSHLHDTRGFQVTFQMIQQQALIWVSSTLCILKVSWSWASDLTIVPNWTAIYATLVTIKPCLCTFGGVLDTLWIRWYIPMTDRRTKILNDLGK